MVVIGLNGFAGVGKDALGGAFVRNHRFQDMGFADALKRIVQGMFKFSDAQMWGPSINRETPDERYPRADGTCLTPREALQVTGTEIARRLYPELWVDTLRADLQGCLEGRYSYARKTGIAPAVEGRPPPAGYVVTDVRFFNEARVIRDLGGQLVRVRRPLYLRPGYAHQSETEVSTQPDSFFDLVVDNDGPLDALDDKAAALLEQLSARLPAA